MIWLPVRFEPLMDLPTQAHLNTLRDVLNYRLVELRADVHAAEQEWLGARAPGRRRRCGPQGRSRARTANMHAAAFRSSCAVA